MVGLSARALAAALLTGAGIAQERSGKGLTCWDKREKCTLDCMMPATENAVIGDVALTSSCIKGCVDAATSCTDSAETIAYVKCAYNCAAPYDAALARCTSLVSEATKGSYGVGLDACANLAAGEMDDCMDSCYGSDRYGKWTPEAEEGTQGAAVTGIEGELWRRPFRDPGVIYGSNRALDSAVAGGAADGYPAGAAGLEGAGGTGLGGQGEEVLAATETATGITAALGGSAGGPGLLTVVASASAMALVIAGLGLLVLAQLRRRDGELRREARRRALYQ